MNVRTVVGETYSANAQGNGMLIFNADSAKQGKNRFKQCDILEIHDGDESAFYNDYDGYGNLKEYGDSLRYRYSHTIVYSTPWFDAAVGKILGQAAEGNDNGEYDGTDLVNACGLAYAKRYEDIEKRYEDGKEQWFDIDGTPLTADKETEYLNAHFEAAVTFRISSAKVMAGLMRLHEEIQEVPQEEMKELESIFYRSRDRYMDAYKAGRITGEPLVFQRFSFGNSALLALLVQKR